MQQELLTIDITNMYRSSLRAVPIFYLECNTTSKKLNNFEASRFLFEGNNAPQIACNVQDWDVGQWRIDDIHDFEPDAIYSMASEESEQVAAKRITAPFITAKTRSAKEGILYPAGSYLVLSEQMVRDPDIGIIAYDFKAMTEEEFNTIYTHRSLDLLAPALEPFNFGRDQIDRAKPYDEHLQKIIMHVNQFNAKATSSHIADIRDEIGRKIISEYFKEEHFFPNALPYERYTRTFNQIAAQIAPNCDMITASHQFKHAQEMATIKRVRDILLKEGGREEINLRYGQGSARKLAQDWANAVAQTNQYFELTVPFAYELGDYQTPRPCADIDQAAKIVDDYGHNRDFVRDQFQQFAGGDELLLATLRHAYAPKIETYFDQAQLNTITDANEQNRLIELKSAVKKQYGLR